MKRKKQKRFIAGLLAMLLVLNVFLPAGSVQADETAPTEVIHINTDRDSSDSSKSNVASNSNADRNEKGSNNREENDTAGNANTDESDVSGNSKPDKSDVASSSSADKNTGESNIHNDTNLPNDPKIQLLPETLMETQSFDEAADRTDWLNPLLKLTITQDKKTVPPGGNIDPGKSFEVKGLFEEIPLRDTNPHLNPGDWAEFELDQKLSLKDMTDDTHSLTFNGKEIGILKFEAIDSGDPSKGLKVRIDFTSDASLWEDYTDVNNLNFTAELTYDGTDIGEGGEGQAVVILGKDYKIYKPVIPIEPTITKKGAKIEDNNKEILWTVTVDAKKGMIQGNR